MAETPEETTDASVGEADRGDERSEAVTEAPEAAEAAPEEAPAAQAPASQTRREKLEVNGNVLEVQDSPKFAVKDRVVLFLKDNGHELVPFVGWTQGVFRVFYDEQTGVDRIKDNSGNPVLAVAGDEIIKGQSLAPLKDGGAGKTNDGSRSEPISRSKED